MKQDQPLIRYANCWEDTGILLRGLRVRAGETGISIASGGDNTFALLLGDPAKIYAFDRNPAQLWCLELKMAAMRTLAYPDVLRLLGICEGDRAGLYCRIRHQLSGKARAYFDHKPEIITDGILHAGKFEHFFQLFRNHVIPLFSTYEIFDEFAALSDPAEQYRFFEAHIHNLRLKAMFRIYFGYRIMGRLGRDKSCYRYVEEKQQSGTDIQNRFIYGISHTPNRTNPYMQYIVRGNFTPRALPLYLNRRYYDRIRSRLDRLVLVEGDLCSLGLKHMDFANLSDIFEYMSDAEFARNADVLAAMLCEDARVLSWNMQNRRYLDTARFTRETERSAALFEQNRSWFYRDVMICRRKPHEPHH